MLSYVSRYISDVSPPGLWKSNNLPAGTLRLRSYNCRALSYPLAHLGHSSVELLELKLVSAASKDSSPSLVYAALSNETVSLMP